MPGQSKPARSGFHVDQVPECELQGCGHVMGVGNPIGILRGLDRHAPGKQAQKPRQKHGCGDTAFH